MSFSLPSVKVKTFHRKVKVLRRAFCRIYSKCVHPSSVFDKPFTMADLSLFRQLAASCATMLPLLPKEEQDEARKMVGKMLNKEVDDKEEDDKTEVLERVSGMLFKEVEDKKAVSEMLTSDEDKKFVKVEAVEQAEDRGPKIVETSEANMKPSDVDEILTRYKIVTEIKEMEMDAVKVESKERLTFSQEKEEEEKEVAEKEADEEVEKDEEEINSVNVEDEESIPGKVESNLGCSTSATLDQSKTEENQSKEKENSLERFEEVAKSEDAQKSPEIKSESRWWKKRRSIDVFEDVEMPLKKIKTEKSENESENKSPGGEAKKRQGSKCGECKGWISKKY